MALPSGISLTQMCQAHSRSAQHRLNQWLNYTKRDFYILLESVILSFACIFANLGREYEVGIVSKQQQQTVRHRGNSKTRPLPPNSFLVF